MNIYKHITRLILAASLILPGMVNAAVVLPALGFQDLSASATEDGLNDIGAILTGSTFSIDATAHEIVTNGLPIDITNQKFSLTSSLNTVTGFYEGSFTAGDGSLLQGTFTNLLIIDLGVGSAIFNADVSYTGGSLMVSPPTGRIEGTIVAKIDSFEDSKVLGKVGAVVPVPAAVWLFGSGILGLVAVARRKKAIQ